MNLLQRKIELKRRSQAGTEDPRLVGACLDALNATVPSWMGEEGWAVARHTSQWVKSSTLTANSAPGHLQLFREGNAVIMVSVTDATALRASAFAMGCDTSDASRTRGAFERHHGRAFTESLWQALTGQLCDEEAGTWSYQEECSAVPFANGPDLLLRLEAPLAREDTLGDYKVVLFAQYVPLPDVVIDRDDEDEDIVDAVAIGDVEDLKDRLGPCRLPVHVVGDQIDLSVADCTRLEIGQVLTLPKLRFDDVSLQLVSGGRRRNLARGTLGMDSGRKAVKLHTPPDPDFFASAAQFIDSEDAPA